MASGISEGIRYETRPVIAKPSRKAVTRRALMDWLSFHRSGWYSPMLDMTIIMPSANAPAWDGTASAAPEIAAPDPARCREMPT